jgi:hypothetical protein
MKLHGVIAQKTVTALRIVCIPDEHKWKDTSPIRPKWSNNAHHEPGWSWNCWRWVDGGCCWSTLVFDASEQNKTAFLVELKILERCLFRYNSIGMVRVSPQFLYFPVRARKWKWRAWGEVTRWPHGRIVHVHAKFSSCHSSRSKQASCKQGRTS